MQQQFIDACEDENLELAQRLFYNNTNTINISAKNEHAFRWACYNGNLEIAQWLLSVKSDINISDVNNWAFRWACFGGHLGVAQWLLSVKPDINISTFSEYAFCSACSNGHLQVAQWLQTLKPYSYVINYNEDGTYKSYRIRSKEEEKRLIQKIYAFWLAGDITPNKDNLLYQFPQDISRLIISYI